MKINVNVRPDPTLTRSVKRRPSGYPVWRTEIVVRLSLPFGGNGVCAHARTVDDDFRQTQIVVPSPALLGRERTCLSTRKI